MKYYLERSYPYGIAIITTVILQRVAMGVMGNENFDDLLGGLVTFDSIVIGFFGAIMPVILSMKNESKFVKYVFENDTKQLFSKYLKVTIFSGLCSAVLSLALYIRDSFVHSFVKNGLYIAWIFGTTLFLTSTYRSLSHMITLVFSKDNFIDVKKKEVRKKEEKELELEKNYSKR
nr:MAG TPA: hypothetical protein [Caudoviricetes sp.]